MTEKLHLILPKVTLGEFGIKPMPTKNAQNNLQMLNMIGFRFGINKNIIYGNQDGLIEIFVEYSIHKMDEISLAN